MGTKKFRIQKIMTTLFAGFMLIFPVMCKDSGTKPVKEHFKEPEIAPTDSDKTDPVLIPADVPVNTSNSCFIFSNDPESCYYTQVASGDLKVNY